MEKTLQDQLTEVETLLEQEKAKGTQKDADVIARLEQQQADLLLQMDAEKAKAEQEAAQQVRIQTQEEKVATITLPYNFNDIFSDEDYKNAQGQPHKITVANDMIVELLQEYKRKDYEDHNAEVQVLTDELRLAKEEVRASAERELQLKRQNIELQGENTALSLHSSDLGDMLDAEKVAHNETKLRVNEIETNRSNAVKQLEESQAEITQLKQWNEDQRIQLEFGVRKAISIVDISPTEKLAQMVKETAAEKANRALDRWKDVIEVQPVAVDPPIAPAGEAGFQPGDTQTSDHPAKLVNTADPAVSTQDGVDHFRPEGEVSTLPVTVASGVSSEDGSSAEAQTVTRYEFETLKADVEVLKRRQGMVA